MRESKRGHKEWLWPWWGFSCSCLSSPQHLLLGCKSSTCSWRIWWKSGFIIEVGEAGKVEKFIAREKWNCEILRMLPTNNQNFANFWTTQHPRQQSLTQLINLSKTNLWVQECINLDPDPGFYSQYCCWPDRSENYTKLKLWLNQLFHMICADWSFHTDEIGIW